MYRGYYFCVLGIIEVKASESALLSVDFVLKKEEEKSTPLINECLKQLDEYFNKKRTTFTLPIEMRGTPFQKQVWKSLTKIPYGKVVSYKDIAINIGKPSSVRAVANAIGANKHVVLIPCHRVIGSNNHLTGFRVGLDRKEYLLNLEGVNNYLK